MHQPFAPRRILLRLSAIAILLLVVSTVKAADLSGNLTDYSNGLPVPGVVVSITAQDLNTTSDDDGHYVLRNIADGNHVVTVFHPAYHIQTFEIEITRSTLGLKRDLELKPSREGEGTSDFMEEEPRYLLDSVSVLTTRASSDHPVTFSNLTSEDVKIRSYGQDLPLLLTDLPNLTAYSDGANGVGYSYLRMRGFSQNRVAVELNGVPLNDAESHEVFWIDLPDFASDVNDVQVQRGVGSSLYGPAALGGAINVVTRTPGENDAALLRAEGSYGTWNTRRAMVQFQSGRIQKRYGFSGRLTKTETDGYRFGSWAKLWSYYLSGARFTDLHTTRFVFYGGPERTHLAYEGVTRDYLDGEVTGDAEKDRRFNPIVYPHEIDNFFQPHYELHDEMRLLHGVSLFNSLYLFRGDGYYDQWRQRKSLEQYFFRPEQQSVMVLSDTLFPLSYYQDVNDDGIPDPDTLANGSVAYHLTKTDLLRRRNIDETDGGWIPRMTVEHRYGTTTIGGEWREHAAHHEGLIRWANPVPADVGPDYHYYDYRISKRTLTGYIHNLITVTPRLRAMFDLQTQSHHLEMKDDELFGVSYERDFSSLIPRLGLNYVLLDGKGRKSPAAVAYGNLSWAEREPAVSDIYDPQDYYSLPVYAPQRFSGSPGRYKYVGPSLKPERLTDAEAGTNWHWRKLHAGVNLYSMSLRDEIIPYGGQLDDNGVPVSGNAERTLHRGVELLAAVTPLPDLTVSGNLALTDHRFVKYREWDWSLNDWAGGFVSRNGKRIAQDPSSVLNLRAQYKYRITFGALSFRNVGRQFVDNTETDNTAVSSYGIVSLDLGCHLSDPIPGVRACEFRLRVNNLLNSEYEAFGYMDENGDARYIVGAPRAIYVTTAVEL